MGIEGIGGGGGHGINRVRSVPAHDEGAAQIVCSARGFIDRVVGNPSGATELERHLPGLSSVHHVREVFAAACAEGKAGLIGVRTMKSIVGAVAEHGVQGAVVGGTVLALTGAAISGGGALTVLGLGAVGFWVLPKLARRAAGAAVDRLEGAAHRLGLELRARFPYLSAP